MYTYNRNLPKPPNVSYNLISPFIMIVDLSSRVAVSHNECNAKRRSSDPLTTYIRNHLRLPFLNFTNSFSGLSPSDRDPLNVLSISRFPHVKGKLNGFTFHSPSPLFVCWFHHHNRDDHR